MAHRMWILCFGDGGGGGFRWLIVGVFGEAGFFLGAIGGILRGGGSGLPGGVGTTWGSAGVLVGGGMGRRIALGAALEAGGR